MNLSRYERNLVGFTVFNTLLSVFTYFNLAFNGIGTRFLDGRIGLVVFVLYILVIFSGKRETVFNKINEGYAFAAMIAIFFMWLLTWASSGVVENSLIIAIVQVGVFLLLNDNLKIKCFDWFVKSFSFILAISLIEFIIYSMTGYGIVLYSSIVRPGESQVILSQLIFNLLTDSDVLSIYRFQSLCEEPGVIGTICGLLIFLTRDNKLYQKQYYIFLLAGLLSFTLAFYVLFFIHLLNKSSFKFKYIFIFCIIIALGMHYFGEFVNDFILLRIVGNDFSSIDNRASSDFSLQFQAALDKGDLWFSNYNKGYNIHGAGLKMFIWRYGIISLVLLFCSYSYIFWKWAKRYKSTILKTIAFFLAFWISFYQRHYITNMEYVLCFFIAPLLFSQYSKK